MLEWWRISSKQVYTVCDDDANKIPFRRQTKLKFQMDTNAYTLHKLNTWTDADAELDDYTLFFPHI